MAIWAMADLHLSLGTDKPMDNFHGWYDYVNRIEHNWRENVAEEDTVVIPGDFSWGIDLEEALPDFRFIENLPGKKLIMKGNHDYWWTTRAKTEKFFNVSLSFSHWSFMRSRLSIYLVSNGSSHFEGLDR